MSHAIGRSPGRGVQRAISPRWTDRKTVSGVPILMNLPIIGHFFKRTNNSKVRSEVVFFLTATEVGAGNRSNAADPRASEGRNKAEIDKKNGGKG